LSTKRETPALTGREVHKLRWDLRRQAKRIRGGGAVRNNGFRSRSSDPLDDFLGGGRPRSETGFDGPDVHASEERHQFLAFLEALKSLINRCSASKMQKFLGANQSTLRKRLGLGQNVLCYGLHDVLCQKIYIIF
jgi:hypothetical protein